LKIVVPGICWALGITTSFAALLGRRAWRISTARVFDQDQSGCDPSRLSVLRSTEGTGVTAMDVASISILSGIVIAFGLFAATMALSDFRSHRFKR
jgi:hypothetical protein